MYVNEIFCSIDGEGQRTGAKAIFIRFAGCNICCDFCDTKYALAKSQADPKYASAADVAEAVTKFCVSGVINNITITGGEPLLYPDEICSILEQLNQSVYAFSINIETNGTISPNAFIERYMHTQFAQCALNDLFFTFDLKTASAGAAAQSACLKSQAPALCPVIDDYRPEGQLFNRRYKDVIKAVVGSAEDLDYVREVYTCWKTRPHEYQWFISPVFGKIDPVDIVAYVLNHDDCVDWRVQLQLHKIIFDPSARGV